MENAQIQYIGARYVTKVYENSQNPNSAEWEADTVYEPLTMVTYQNGSYLSRKTIPATVGNPAANGVYWAQTGFYNGQISHLQNQIDVINNTTIPAIESDIIDLSNEIDNTKSVGAGKHTFLVIGDSYGMRPDSQPTWSERIVLRFPTARQKSYSGIGFGTDYVNNKNFYWVAEQFVAELTDDEKEEITDVIVCGGWNDARELLAGNITAGDLQQLIFAFVTYCNTHFPNAKIWIGFIGWQTANRVQTGVDFASLQTVQEIYEYTMYKNLYHLTNASSVMKCSKLMDDSFFHPNPTGSTFLFEVIMGEIFGGTNFDFKYDLSSTDFTFSQGSGSLSKGSVAIHNEMARIYLQFGSVTGNTTDPITITYGNRVMPTGHMNASSTRFIAMSSNDNKALYGIITPNSIIVYGTENLSNDTILIDIVLNTRYEC